MVTNAAAISGLLESTIATRSLRPLPIHLDVRQSCQQVLEHRVIKASAFRGANCSRVIFTDCQQISDCFEA